MYDSYPHLPHDIALEKRTADRLKRRYANAAFGGLRNFHALRCDAPGIIAKFLLATAFSITALLYFFRDLNVVGLFPVIGLCIKVVIVIGLSFWITGVIWRSVGLTVRNGIRYVVSNIWSLVATSMLATSAVLYLFFPQTREVPTAQAAVPKPPPEIVAVAAPKPVRPARHELPQDRRVFEGESWRILRNEDFSYSTAVASEATGQCQALGEDWILADRPDFEGLEAELVQGGHVGSFWTASARPKTSLDYSINTVGDSRFRWVLSGNDSERIVLCVVAIQID